MQWRRLGSFVVLAAVVATVTSCAEQRDPIDRVGAYALPKSLFTGEWYYQQTVVDVPGAYTFTMVGSTNYRGMHRIRWDIQENYLYARKAYENIPGAKDVSEDTGEYMGAIVGAWRIGKHFDVKRGYNPMTGEENNVLEENAVDCKWHNCTWFRVDWSQNLAIDYMFLDGDEDIIKQPVSFYAQDENDERWKPVFDPVAGYIDFTSAMAIDPGKKSMYGYTYPLCWWFDYAHAECNTELIKIRNSFMRRDPNQDYEPRTHQGTIDEWFGFFVNDRQWWKTERGMTQLSRDKFINRHNLWIKHHHATACTDDSDCAQHGAGSRCNKFLPFHKHDVVTDTDGDGLPDSFEIAVGLDPNNPDTIGNGVLDRNGDYDGNGKRDLEDYWAWAKANLEHRCTLPMTEREPRPIAYFNTGFFPRDLVCDKTDTGTGPCKSWTWTGDKKKREAEWSALHHISNDYDETWFKVFLRGGYEWSQDDFQKWIQTRDPSQLSKDRQDDLKKFGDKTHGYYAFTICPNNPVLETDPWPCRFRRHSFAQANELMEKGLTFNHLPYETALKLLEAKQQPSQERPLIRNGDIRYSNVNFVKDYYDGWALLGLGPSHTDPRTGENLAGVANVYALNEWAATYVQEMVLLLNGDISPTDFINGVNLRNWLAKIEKQNTQEGQPEGLTPDQLKAAYGATYQPWMKQIQPVPGFDVNKLADEQGNPMLTDKQIRRKLLNTLQDTYGLFDPSKHQGGLHLIKGTALEKKMIDSDILMAAGLPPASTKELNPAVMQQVAPSNGGVIGFAEAQEEWKYELSNTRNMDFLSMADDAMVGLAYRLKDECNKAGYDGPSDDCKTHIYKRARDIIMRAVLTHEMGHTFGLHHNWAGSEDVLNFHPEYWRLRTDDFTRTEICAWPNPRSGDLCPLFVKGSEMTDFMLGRSKKNLDQGLKSMYEYAYSSVMDYAGRYTIDGSGLGRYDKAAIIYGHADKVEVYDKVPTMLKTGPNSSIPVPENLFDSWFSSNGSPLIWGGLTQGGPPVNSWHYTLWWPLMGKDLHDEANRKLVPYTDLKEVRNAQGSRSNGYFYVEGNTAKPRLPYLFCTYTRGDISSGCNTRDYGSDEYERMKQHIDNWDTWYVLRAFTRYQYPWRASDYPKRNYRRTYRVLKNFNNTYALYQGLLLQYFGATATQSFFSDPVTGWGAYTKSVNDGFNMALRTLAMPDVKSFLDKAEEADGQKIYSECPYMPQYCNFSTDLSNARYFASSWYTTDYEDICGLNFWECLHHVGFYLDKIMALTMLTDYKTYFVARDTAEDIREWSISFFDNFTNQIIDFFGAMLSHDYDHIGPWYDPTKPQNATVTDANGAVWNNRIGARDYAYPSNWVPGQDPVAPLNPAPAKPATGGAIEASTRFTLQIYAAVYGMMLFQGNYDNEFVERARMWRDGKGTGWNVTPTAKVDGQAKYVDPWTGTTYVGLAYKDKRGIAQRMIDYANRLKSRSKFCDLDPGEAAFCQPVAATMKATAESALYQYRQLMDILVQITTVYDTKGQNWSDDPYDP